MTDETNQKTADVGPSALSDLLGAVALPRFFTVRKCSQCGRSDEWISLNGCPERCGRKTLTECPVCHLLLDEDEIIGSCTNTAYRTHRRVTPNASLSGASHD